MSESAWEAVLYVPKKGRMKVDRVLQCTLELNDTDVHKGKSHVLHKIVFCFLTAVWHRCSEVCPDLLHQRMCFLLVR